MRFVVVGGSGFIGSHLVEELLASGDEVLVIDNFANSSPANLPQHPHLKILNHSVLSDSLNITNDFGTATIDGIAHLAATPSVQASWESPLDSHHDNLSTTLATIQLCQKLQIPRLVFTSSAAVYGDQRQLPIHEEQVPQPLTPYGLQKLTSERYLSLFAKEAGFSAIALRLFNVFGPRQSPNSPYSGVISIFASRMQANLPLVVYGDGSQSRDFIYVQDVALALSSALKVFRQSGSFTVCNLGNQSQISVLQLLETLKHLIPSWSQSVHFIEPRLGDIQHSQAKIQRAVDLLNWEPNWSIKAGLTKLLSSNLLVPLQHE